MGATPPGVSAPAVGEIGPELIDKQLNGKGVAESWRRWLERVSHQA
jgi:hypothetical protein